MTGGPAGEGSNLGLYWGDDAYAIERAIDALAQRVGSAAGGPPERWRVGGDATSASLIGERLATATMFGGGSLAIVSEPWPLLRSKAGREELAGVLGNERSNIVRGYRLATPIQRELVELADRDHALAPPVDVALGDHGTDPGGELASRPGFEANRTLSGSILDPSRHRPTLRSLELACFAAGASDELAQGVQGGRGLR